MMVDLTKIEKPYGLCTKEEQEGLDALKEIRGALQSYSFHGWWQQRENGPDLFDGMLYRQDPDWEPPKLDVPDWLWENTTANFIAMDSSGMVYAYEVAPLKGVDSWIKANRWFSLTLFTFKHNFNPHNIPWHQSLTKRPEE